MRRGANDRRHGLVLPSCDPSRPCGRYSHSRCDSASAASFRASGGSRRIGTLRRGIGRPERRKPRSGGPWWCTGAALQPPPALGRNRDIRKAARLLPEVHRGDAYAARQEPRSRIHTSVRPAGISRPTWAPGPVTRRREGGRIHPPWLGTDLETCLSHNMASGRRKARVLQDPITPHVCSARELYIASCLFSNTHA